MAIAELVSAFKGQNPAAYDAIFQAGADSVSASQFEAGKTAGATEERTKLEAKFGTNVGDAKAFTEAFGAKGALAFVEGKSFVQATNEHLADLKAAHDADLRAKDEQLAAMQAKLEAMPRGNEAASFQAEPKAGADTVKGKPKPGSETYADGKIGDGLGAERFAASIKLPDAK